MHLVKGHVLTQAVPRTECKRAAALTVVAGIDRVIEPTLGDKAVGIEEIVRATVRRIVMDRHASSSGDGASRHIHP